MEKNLKYFNLIFSICLFALGFLILLRVLFLPTYPDFSVYYTAALQAVVGEDPYITATNSIPFVYPPITLVLFAPLTIFSLFWAGKIWVTFSIIFIFISMLVMWELVKKTMPLWLYLLLCACFFFAFPTKFTLGMGQINIGILMLLVVGSYYYLMGKETISGICFGIAFIFKFFPALFLLYFFFRKNTKVLFSIFVLFFLSIVIPPIFFPSIDMYSYWFVRLPTYFSGMPTDYYNQAISGFLARFFSYSAVLVGIKNLVTIFVIGISFSIINRYEKKDTRLLSLSLLVIVNVLCNTFSWQHHFVLLFISFISVVFYLIKFRLAWYYYWLVGISILLINGNLKDPQLFPVIFQSHVFFGALLLSVIHYRLLILLYEK